MGAIFIGTVVAVLLAVRALAAKAQKDVNERGGCPGCGMPVPMYRPPTSLRQALWGGWTCSGCGLEMDRYGREFHAHRALK